MGRRMGTDVKGTSLLHRFWTKGNSKNVPFGTRELPQQINVFPEKFPQQICVELKN